VIHELTPQRCPVRIFSGSTGSRNVDGQVTQVGGLITSVMKGFITLEPMCPSAAALQRQNGNETGITAGGRSHHFALWGS
jgi:hypothetical protein